MRAIDADHLRRWILSRVFKTQLSVADVIDQIDREDTIEPERMRAKWIATTSLQEGQITWRDYKCSNCSHHREKPMNFCEVCGAKMER